MIQRIQWQRVERPRHFLAHLLGGMAEVWWQPSGTRGPESLWVRVQCGETIHSSAVSDKQAGADRAVELWPLLTEQERQPLAKLADEDDMVTMLKAAQRIGAVTVEAFDVPAASNDRLASINWHLRDMGALFGPLRPLAEAVSAELYRRRITY